MLLIDMKHVHVCLNTPCKGTIITTGRNCNHKSGTLPEREVIIHPVP